MLETIVLILPSVLNQFLLLLLLASIFAVVGMQLFSGRFGYHCFDQGTGRLLNAEELCSPYHGASLAVSGRLCEDTPLGPSFCADAGFSESLNFNSFGAALLTVLVCATGEGWPSVMYGAWDTLNSFSTLYFVMLELLLYLYIIQLLVPFVWILLCLSSVCSSELFGCVRSPF